MARNEVSATLRFGGFELDPGQRRLTGEGRIVAIAPRAFDLLHLLADRAGHLVTKDEIFAAVWPRVVVAENNLQVQVSSLRKILGADAIETVSSAGYRFNVAVERTGKACARRRDNLPSELTPFLARDREVADVCAHLTDCDLVTIAGVGGLGKTRLALRVAETMKARYADGACWVDLAPVADAAMVPHAIACALGVVDTGSVIESIVLHLSDRETLLVLDNCEHVVASCAAMARRILEHAPSATILATSREPLRIVGETVYGLSPLGVAGSVDAVMDSESARLFVERARVLSPDFDVEGGDVAILGRICERLEGIPLAIELAAARVRMLPLAAIEARLAERFALLTTGDRTALPRQHTLRAMVDWSYELLAAEERTAFARLAVFAGGCTLADAEKVITDGALAEYDVLDLLSALVAKSLVLHDLAADRYRFLETIRLYALERLAGLTEEPRIRELHLRRFLDCAQRAEPDLRGPAWLASIARLTADRDNFLAAHAWCGRSGRAEEGLWLLDALRIWWFRTSLDLGCRIAREALSWPAAQQRTRARCLGCYAAASIAYYAGRYEEAIGYAEESLAIAREIGDRLKTVDALVIAGLAQLALEPAGARDTLAHALAMAREAGDATRLCDALTSLAECLSLTGDRAGAIPLYEESVARNRAVGNSLAVAVGTCNLVRIRIPGLDGESARAALREVASTLDATAPEGTMQMLLVVCAGLAAHEGDGEGAALLYGAAEMDLAHRAAAREAAEEQYLQPLLALARARTDAARFDAAQARGRALDYRAAMREVDAFLQPAS